MFGIIKTYIFLKKIISNPQKNRIRLVIIVFILDLLIVFHLISKHLLEDIKTYLEIQIKIFPYLC